MKPFLFILMLSLLSGCTRDRYSYHSPDGWMQPLPGDLLPPVYPGNASYPCAEQYSSQNTPVYFTDSIKSDTIKGIAGVNAMKLLASFKAAIAVSGFSEDRASRATVREDEITIDLTPVAFGNIAVKHRIVAQIHSEAKEIGVQVSSVALDSAGRPTNDPVNRRVSEQVFQKLKSALTSDAR